MRLPNGFGSVSKLQGHRRRPWVAKKTIEGRQKALGYFETHDAALTFLLQINHEPHSHLMMTATSDGNKNPVVTTKWAGSISGAVPAHESKWVDHAGAAVQSGTTGNGKPHNNISPSFASYMWQRTA